jgi:beta-lactamase regulating signal transducer with metallopeptidase domain/Leucine-rich repeat (LRR) protein
MIAAVILPALSGAVKQLKWGVLAVPPRVVEPESVALTGGGETATQEPTVTGSATRKVIVLPEEAGAVATSEAGGTDPAKVLLSAWVVTSSILVMRLGTRLALGYGLVREAGPMWSGPITDVIGRTKAKMHIKRGVTLRCSARIRSPMIWCWDRRPILLVPANACRNDAPLGWPSIVCHELAHWKRLDHVSGLFAELMVCALPWQPLSWLSRRQLVRLSEEACDDWVLACGQPGPDYAETLLGLVSQRKAVFAPTVVRSKRDLRARIQRILGERWSDPQAGERWSVTVVLLAACFTIGIAFAQTRPAETEDIGRGLPERTRTLVFPEDQSLGILYLRDIGPEDWHEGWTKAGEARGRVRVPAYKEVKLEVRPEAAADLSPLAELAPDDLQMLCFGWKAVTVGSLAWVGRLTGLHALNLQSVQLDSRELRHLTGLSELEVLRLGGQTLADGSMQYVGQLTSLRFLALWNTSISDEGLQYLQGLTKLTFLALNNCQITDEGLRYLKDMTALEGLQLSQTKISDRGLVHLETLTRLKHIKLDGNGITDAGMRHIERLTSLENIWINTNPLTDLGLASLSGMTNLGKLYATDTQITDAGLAHLEGLKHLDHITIARIGDSGIAHLSKLPSLRLLQISDARVTEASIPHFQAMKSIEGLLLSGGTANDTLFSALREALPHCKVWDPQRRRENPGRAGREPLGLAPDPSPSAQDDRVLLCESFS